MWRGLFVLIVIAACCAWLVPETFAQVIRTAPIGGGGVNVGPIGGGLSTGYNNPLGGAGNLTAPNLGGSLNTSLPQVPTVQDLPTAQPVYSGGSAAATADDDQPSQYQPLQTSPSHYGGEANSSYDVSAAAGGGPPPEAGGDDDDDDDDDGDDGSAQEEDDEEDEDERKFNWWIWGPVALVGFIVVVNLFNRGR
jgi:hypothetical protein